jgi:ubiquinone/menaquinone biosynthesis C-methylase UbiE
MCMCFFVHDFFYPHSKVSEFVQEGILVVMDFLVPQNAVTHFHLLKGDRVLDVGAGSGHFSFAVARAVMPDGRVYALEIQKDLAERIAREARAKRITNIETLWGDLESPQGIRIGDATIDAVIVANVLFQIGDRKRALAEVTRMLRPGGKLFVIDWVDSYGGMGPHPDLLVSEDEAKRLVASAGFDFIRTFPAGSHHYGLAFKKL